MNKEKAITFIKNMIMDLKDDLDHEECVEQDWLAVNRLNWEIGGFEEVLGVLLGESNDLRNNAKDFIWDKISVLECNLLDEKDKVRKYNISKDLEEYKNVIECMPRNIDESI